MAILTSKIKIGNTVAKKKWKRKNGKEKMEKFAAIYLSICYIKICVAVIKLLRKKVWFFEYITMYP